MSNWTCKRYGTQRGGLRGKDNKQQTFYANMSDLAYKNVSVRMKKLPEGFKLDRDLSNEDIMIAYNPTTKEVVSAVTGSRFTSRKHAMRDIRSDLGIAMGTDRLGKRTKEVGSIVKKAKVKYGDYDHTLTGHSLGGRVAQNISKQTGVPAVVFNRGSSPLGVVSDKVSKILGRDSKESKVIHYTTNKKSTVDPVSISAKLAGDDAETNLVDKKKDGGISHSIDHFTGEGKKKVSPWIAHVRNTRKKHGCSYKEALGLASKTYKK